MITVTQGLKWLGTWMKSLRGLLEYSSQSKRKMHWLKKLIKSACNCLLSIWQALELEIRLQMNLLFKSTPDSCLVFLGTHQWCSVSGQFSHHQAYLAVAGNSDGHSAFRVGLWSLFVSCQCYLSLAWINSNSLKRVWKGPSVCQLYSTVAQATGHTYNLGEPFFGCPVHVTVEEWLPVV